MKKIRIKLAGSNLFAELNSSENSSPKHHFFHVSRPFSNKLAQEHVLALRFLLITSERVELDILNLKIAFERSNVFFCTELKGFPPKHTFHC